MDDDDDDSSDSDYCPENDGNASESDHADDEVKGLVEITAGRKRKAYSAFDDLKREVENETKAKMSKAIMFKDNNVLLNGGKSSTGGSTQSQKKKLKKVAQYNEMLASVFGGSAPKKSHSAKKLAMTRPKKEDDSRTSTSQSTAIAVTSSETSSEGLAAAEAETNTDSNSIRLAALEVAKRVLKKTKVVETKKFAGQDIK